MHFSLSLSLSVSIFRCAYRTVSCSFCVCPIFIRFRSVVNEVFSVCMRIVSRMFLLRFFAAVIAAVHSV